jgi:hypothetical protein
MRNNQPISASLILIAALGWTERASADALASGITCENTAETAFEIIQKHFDFQLGRIIPSILIKREAITLKQGEDKVLCKIIYDIFDRDTKLVGRAEVPYTATETHNSPGIDVSVYRSETEMMKSPERKQGEQLQASAQPHPPSKEVARTGETSTAYVTPTNGDKYVGETNDGHENGNRTFTYANGDQYGGEFKISSFEGDGACTWANGDRYGGEFESGKKDGVATYVLRNGETKSWNWENNQLVEAQTTQAAPEASHQPAPEFVSDDGEKFVATYNVHGAILRSQTRIVNLGVSCDANSPQFAKGAGSWHQSPIGIAVTFPGSKVAIGFSRQNLGIAACAAK